MRDNWRPIVGGKTKRKDWSVRFLIDYNNVQLRDFWKRDFTYARGIRFDYYNVKADILETTNDIYYTDFAVVYNQFIEDIPNNDSCYMCYINELSNVKDIDGLLYRIATNKYVDLLKYNTLTAIKSKKIKDVVL